MKPRIACIKNINFCDKPKSFQLNKGGDGQKGVGIKTKCLERNKEKILIRNQSMPKKTSKQVPSIFDKNTVGTQLVAKNSHLLISSQEVIIMTIDGC